MKRLSKIIGWLTSSWYYLLISIGLGIYYPSAFYTLSDKIETLFDKYINNHEGNLENNNSGTSQREKKQLLR